MKQLSSADFINELKIAPEWQMIQGPGTGQLCLAVRSLPEADPEYFLGPQPMDMEDGDYRAFAAAIEDVISMRSTHDDQSITDVSVSAKEKKGRRKK